MIIGAQMYTVTAYCQSELDFARSIKKIADTGYTVVQISGVADSIPTKTIRRICDDAGLSIAITHGDDEETLFRTEDAIEKNDILGCRYIGLGSMPNRYRSPEWVRYFAEDAGPAAEKIRSAGKRLMYHHHSFEFFRCHAEGSGAGEQRIIDYLLDWFSPEELGITLDTYWVQHAGADVVEWIRKLKDRICCVHLKDMAAGIDNAPLMAPVLSGNMNFISILRELDRHSCCQYALVEQDWCYGRSPFDCLAESFRNLHSAGYC